MPEDAPARLRQVISSGLGSILGNLAFKNRGEKLLFGWVFREIICNQSPHGSAFSALTKVQVCIQLVQ
jgi:hypothetical protein